MNKNEKDFMENLTDLDSEAVEEIAEDYPALDEHIQKRILKQCLHKSGLPDGDIEITENTGTYEDDSDEDEISVSGIERYDRPLWYKYAGSVAVMAVAIVGIASVVVLHGNLNNNEDFDISSPPVVSDVAPTNQGTEIVTGSYIDNGYVANGGIDYADQNDYQGIVVDGTTASEPDNSADSGEIPETDNNISTPEQNNQPQVTAPPATTPPVTEAPTAPPATEPPTEALSEAQKTFLSGLYYISFPDGDGNNMGMEFMTDGTLMWYTFSDYGTIMDGTMVKCNYEIIGNQFSFSDVNNESDKKVGTIVNPNDGGDFTVQFEDGIWNFSIEPPVFRLTGVWYGTSDYGLRRLELYDDTSGNFTYLQSGSGLGFEYRIENDRIYFQNGSVDYIAEGDIISYNEGVDMTVLWSDGITEYFYSEQQWLAMNQ